MFNIGEKVVYKTNAVCSVEAVETPVFVTQKDRKYYKLKHLFSGGNEVVYVPVDSAVGIRCVMTHTEAEDCLKRLGEIQAESFEPRQHALLAGHFQQLLLDCTLDGELLVIKEILLRERKYAETGKKLRQAELHYLSIVEKALSEELSIALDVGLDEAKEAIRQAVFA